MCDPSKPTISGISQDFVEKLISEHISCLYKLENSIDINKLNEYILKNFSLIMNSIFQTKGNTSLPYSIVHEYLEDTFLNIYDVYITDRMNYIKENHIDTKDKNLWSINYTEISNKTLEVISERIFDNNLINILINSSNYKAKTINQTIDSFIKDFSKYMENTDNGENDLIRYMADHKEILKQIKFVQNRNKESSIKEILSVVNLSKNYIKDGKLIYKGKILYDFQNYYTEMLSKGYMGKNNVYLTQNISLPYHIDNLVQTFKYNNELEQLYLYGSNSFEFPLEKLIITILLYCPELKGFSITESNLQGLQLYSIIRLIDCSHYLKTLDLSSNQMHERGVKLITEALKSNKTLTYLSLSNNDLQSSCGIYFGEALSCNSTLEKLSIGGNNINGKGFHSFSTSLINNNKTLKQLDISHNKLQDSDLNDIAKVIAKNKVLEAINISNTKYSSDQINILGSAIKDNNYLKTIYLNNIELDTEKAPYLFYSLSESKLDALYLDNNPIEEIGAILFSNAIKNSKTLKIVSLKQCKLNNSSLICLSKAIEINNSLQYLSIEENKFDDNSILVLKKAVSDKNITIILSSCLLSPKSIEAIKSCSKNFKLT